MGLHFEMETSFVVAREVAGEKGRRMMETMRRSRLTAGATEQCYPPFQGSGCLETSDKSVVRRSMGCQNPSVGWKQIERLPAWTVRLYEADM